MVKESEAGNILFFVKNSRKTFLIFVTSAVLRHAVAHAHFRKNVPGFVGIRLELAADAGHVHPEDLVVASEVVLDLLKIAGGKGCSYQ